jgi:hypothetical protein
VEYFPAGHAVQPMKEAGDMWPFATALLWISSVLLSGENLPIRH